jgi:hypothetical protein
MLAAMRPVLLASLLLVAGSAVAPAAIHPQPPQATSAGESTKKPEDIAKIRAADSYAIYSLLLPGQPFSSMAPNQTTRWAIAATTVNFNDMNPRIAPQGLLKPPPGSEKAFQQAVRDFESRRFEHLTLEPRLQVNHAYDLLSADQVAALRAAKSSPDPGSQLQSRYASYPGVTFFSEVYFDAAQQAALVYMSNWCASLCAQGQWIYLEKRNGQWQRRSGITRPGA